MKLISKSFESDRLITMKALCEIRYAVAKIMNIKNRSAAYLTVREQRQRRYSLFADRQSRISESGNAIIYIFVAIALLAALSFAVSQSSRSAGKGLQEDRASLSATEIISYGDTVAKAAGQLRLRGVRDYQLSFAHTSAHTDYGTYDTEPRAEIFNPAGGGVIYRQPPVLAAVTPPLTYEFSGAYAIDRIGLTGCTLPANDPSACSELLLVVSGLRREVCQMINHQLGITQTKDADPPEDDALPTTPRFAGNATATPNPYTFTETMGDDGDSELLRQQTAGCYLNPGSSSYVYYQVLIAR